MAIDISSTTRRIVYTGSAGVGPYAFNFEVLAQTDVAVYFNNTELTLTTDYTVSVSGDGTGSVTIVTGTNVPSTPTASDRITIIGDRTIERTTDFTTGGPLFATSLNDEFDSQTIFVQQVQEQADRSLRAPNTDPTTVNMTLPINTIRANKTLAFDANGDPTIGELIGDYRGNWAAGTSYNKRDLIKDTSNSNIYICQVAHTSSGSLPITTNTDVAKWDLIVDAATASGYVTEAEDWAIKTDGIVDSTDYSSKAWSIGGTGVTNTASRGAAKEWATKAEDSTVDGSEYSAKHYSAKASASASAASSSASAASTSASNASTYATNASNAQTAAESAQSAAEAARDSALAAYDNFDDRYLGVKTSDPTVDNDGDALVAGALYYNSTDEAMKLYTGSAWVAAYVTGDGFLATANNLSDVSSASAARTNLGLEIGVDVQGYDADTAKLDVVQTWSAKQVYNDGIVQGFGTDEDLRIYHSGTNSFIDDVGTGDLNIRGASVNIKTAGGVNYFTGSSNVSTLYHTGNAKLATTSTGIDVTGTVATDRATGTVTTDNDLSFDLSATNNFQCTPTAGGTLTFTNHTAGQSGYVLLDNSGGHAITAAATTKITTADLTTISTAGVYLISYFDNGTNAYLTVSASYS